MKIARSHNKRTIKGRMVQNDFHQFIIMAHCSLYPQNSEEEILRQKCQICGTPAPRGGKHYFHYGAICCSKCKAFFRRCKRCGDRLGVDFPDFACLSGTYNCIIDHRNAEKCKKCRLVKCLQAGKKIVCFVFFQSFM